MSCFFVVAVVVFLFGSPSTHDSSELLEELNIRVEQGFSFQVCLGLPSTVVSCLYTSTGMFCGQRWSVSMIERVLVFLIGSKYATGMLELCLSISDNSTYCVKVSFFFFWPPLNVHLTILMLSLNRLHASVKFTEKHILTKPIKIEVL